MWLYEILNLIDRECYGYLKVKNRGSGFPLPYSLNSYRLSTGIYFMVCHGDHVTSW